VKVAGAPVVAFCFSGETVVVAFAGARVSVEKDWTMLVDVIVALAVVSAFADVTTIEIGAVFVVSLVTVTLKLDL